jgi:AcrR family transcriptional regulator
LALAERGGLAAVTIRDVARRANLSAGLVLFHFGSKDELVLALLDRVLATATARSAGPAIDAIQDPQDRLTALLRLEMARLARDRKEIRLFFEFWSAGMWNRAIRARMQRELDRYRTAFHPLCEALIKADPTRFAGVTVAGLSAAVVGFIKGCAVQLMIEPDLDISEFLNAAEGLLGATAAAGSAVAP